MANLPEVPTEELLSFQDYPAVHNSGNSLNTSAQLNLSDDNFDTFKSQENQASPLVENSSRSHILLRKQVTYSVLQVQIH